jgi:hypothetical protein
MAFAMFMAMVMIVRDGWFQVAEEAAADCFDRVGLAGAHDTDTAACHAHHEAVAGDRKSTRLNSSHNSESRMPSSA